VDYQNAHRYWITAIQQDWIMLEAEQRLHPFLTYARNGENYFDEWNNKVKSERSKVKESKVIK
jgi:hypothetical protein